MSYDIRLKVKVADMKDKYITVAWPEHDSPTYNLRPIFEKSMGWDYSIGELYKCDKVIEYVEAGLRELRNPSKEAEYKKLEPGNGWGSVRTAIECLESLRTRIYELAEDEGLPLENIYMSW